MTESIRPDIEQRLIAALREEAEIAMTMTNTPQQLERFQHETSRRRTRARIGAAAAAAAVIAGGIYTATAVGGSPAHRGHTVITHLVPEPPVKSIVFPAAPTVLPKTQVTAVRGPDSFGVLALGSVWAENGSPSAYDILYRISMDGARIESTLHFNRPANAFGGPLPPFRAGSALLLPATVGGHDGYLVIDAAGRRVGQLSVPTAGVGVGDATGAWAIVGDSTVARISADGRRVIRQLNVKGTSITALDAGGGALWLLDDTSKSVLRVDPATGNVLGRHTFATSPVSLVYDNGAVYVSTKDYDVSRVDATTMKVTANETELGANEWAWQVLTVGPDHSLWTTPGTAAVAQLDLLTLKPIRFVATAANTLSQAGGGSGPIAVTADRVFVDNMSVGTLESFPRP